MSQEAVKYYPNVLGFEIVCLVPGRSEEILFQPSLYTGDLQKRTRQTELGSECQPGHLKRGHPAFQGANEGPGSTVSYSSL